MVIIIIISKITNAIITILSKMIRIIILLLNHLAADHSAGEVEAEVWSSEPICMMMIMMMIMMMMISMISTIIRSQDGEYVESVTNDCDQRIGAKIRAKFADALFDGLGLLICIEEGRRCKVVARKSTNSR